MNRDVETIKCYFVSKDESQTYLEENNLKNTLSILDCNAKIKTNERSDNIYTYCSRKTILDQIKETSKDKILSTAVKTTSSANEYDEYRFKYGDRKLLIFLPIQNQDMIDRDFSSKDWDLEDARTTLDKVVNVTVKINRRKKFKQVMSTIVAIGAIGAVTALIVKANDNNDYQEPDVYERYYKDIMSRDRFEEMAGKIREPQETTKTKTK